MFHSCSQSVHITISIETNMGLTHCCIKTMSPLPIHSLCLMPCLPVVPRASLQQSHQADGHRPLHCSDRESAVLSRNHNTSRQPMMLRIIYILAVLEGLSIWSVSVTGALHRDCHLHPRAGPEPRWVHI